MLGLSLDLPSGSLRAPLSGAPPVPVPTPIPTPTAITNVVIEGDSITSTTPDANATTQAGDATGAYSYRYRAHQPAKTIRIRAQASRVAIRAGFDSGGMPIYFVDGDGQNSLASHVAEDVAYGPQLITYMIGTNDMAAMDSAAQYIDDLKLLYAQYKAENAAVSIAWSMPTALNSETQAGFYPTFMAKRAALLGLSVRDPGVWKDWCDYYFPMGEQPDLVTGGNALFGGDTVHPNSAGHGKMYTAYEPFMDSLLDASRMSSTIMYDAAWPTSQTGLSASTAYVFRFVVSGLAHKGIALTGGNALSAANGQISLNGDAFGPSKSGWLYNGDTIDLKITTSSSSATAINADVKIGTETRTLSYTTVAQVAPAAYTHGGIVGDDNYAADHMFAGLDFTATGVAVIAVCATAQAIGVTVGGVAATRRALAAPYDVVEVWTAPVAAVGSKSVVVSYAAPRDLATIAWGVVTNADPTPVQIDQRIAPGDATYPTGPLTVPASGVAIGWFGEYTGTNGTVQGAGNTQVDSAFGPTHSGENFGLTVGKRMATGVITFARSKYGDHPICALVFKAAGA